MAWFALLPLGLLGCQGEGGNAVPPAAPEAAGVASPTLPTAPAPAASRRPAAAPARYLALGDSYTIGEGVPPPERWPAHLARLLAAEGVALGPPQILARTGWTSDELLRALEAARPEGPFQLVTLLVGVNDQFRGRPAASFRAPLRELLARARALAGGEAGRVVAVSIPDWGATAFGRAQDRAAIAAGIDAMNALFQAEAEAAGAAWVDVTGLSRRAGEDPAFLARDGLHPSGAAYAEWAAAALPAARRALQGAPSPR